MPSNRSYGQVFLTSPIRLFEAASQVIPDCDSLLNSVSLSSNFATKVRTMKKGSTILSFIIAAILLTGQAGFADSNAALENLQRTKKCQACDLSLMDFSGATLTGVDLAGADVSSADFSDADLTGADLTSATLARADLSGANLSFAKFRDAVLASANLSNANLTSADLSGADLRDANLTGANLIDATVNGAYLTDADLSGAVWIDGSKCQTGSNGNRLK